MNTVHPIKTCLSRTFLSHVKSESPRQIPSSSVLQTRKLNHIKWLICYLYFVYNACVASSYKWICSVFLHYWNNLRNGYWKVVLIAFCDTCFNFLQPVWDSMVTIFMKSIPRHLLTIWVTLCILDILKCFSVAR